MVCFITLIDGVAAKILYPFTCHARFALQLEVFGVFLPVCLCSGLSAVADFFLRPLALFSNQLFLHVGIESSPKFGNFGFRTLVLYARLFHFAP